MWTQLELNSLGPYPSSEREIKFFVACVRLPQKHEIKHFHVVVVQKRQRKVQKSVKLIQSCCYTY